MLPDTFRTTRFLLRPVVVGDANAIFDTYAQDEEVARDPHLEARDMMVRMPRPDDPDRPVLIPGNPVKISGMPAVQDRRVPWLGEHTDAVLQEELGLSGAEIEVLRADSVIV